MTLPERIAKAKFEETTKLRKAGDDSPSRLLDLLALGIPAAENGAYLP